VEACGEQMKITDNQTFKEKNIEVTGEDVFIHCAFVNCNIGGQEGAFYNCIISKGTFSVTGYRMSNCLLFDRDSETTNKQIDIDYSLRPTTAGAIGLN
jgi:hypothetical protein